MSEELTVNNGPLAETNEGVGDEHAHDERRSGTQSEKRVPVSEAIRYRKRAQAAEKELLELKERHDKQSEELAALKEIRAGNVSDRSGQAESLKTPSLLQSTPPLQGESLNKAVKTQGVKETRTSGARGLLQNAAKQAAGSGSRSDVQEYLRIRRSYV